MKLIRDLRAEIDRLKVLLQAHGQVRKDDVNLQLGLQFGVLLATKVKDLSSPFSIKSKLAS